MTASQISRAKLSSVLVKLSGEYSSCRRVPAATSGAIWALRLATPSVARRTVSAGVAWNTYSRCLGEVEL